MAPERAFHFAIDRGGTFTDVFAMVPDGSGGVKHRALKLLSEDPGNYADAPREGIRRILEQETGLPHPRSQRLDTSRIASIRMGTTVATNALLERKGERSALVVTAGFKDLLHIGNQSRPNIFDLEIRCPDTLYESVVEVDEHVILPLGDEPSQRNGKLAAQNSTKYPPGGPLAKGVTGEVVCVRKPPDLVALESKLKEVYASGVHALAVVLKHAAVYPEHEKLVGQLARSIGFTQVSLSHEVMPMVKMVPRGFTAAADAYLTPHIMRYIQTFQSGFDDGLKDVQVLFMQSDGGLCRADAFSGHKAVLSGPAGGVVGAALTTGWEGHPAGSLQIIGFDMGGTSTDVSRYAGSYEHVFETTTAGVTIQAPQLDVNTVAAGGGSRLLFKGGLFAVGPESVGAHPGPVCYKKGGMPAITDANAVLGRIVPDFFPQIFGPKENEPLDVAGAEVALQRLTDEVNAHAVSIGKPAKSRDEVAAGFVVVANEAMARPIRALTQMKGYDASAHVLTCFGGAGGQHACAIAASLGMKTIFIHRYASILSAVGIARADVVHEQQEPVAAVLGGGAHVAADLDARLGRLEAATRDALARQGFEPGEVNVERFLNLRYQGTDVAVMTSRPPDGDYAAAFAQAYKREFGFTLDRPIVVDDVRVRGTGSSPEAGKQAAPATTAGAPLPEPCLRQSAYFSQTGRVQVPVYKLDQLAPGHALPGPTILIDQISTVVVEPGCTAHITVDGNVRIDVHGSGEAAGAGEDVAAHHEAADPIKLAIFSHRFMGIAEQMGRTLQRTSISVNIKERLDFSCALFGPDGSLVANAPHLPVHLGAMSEAVRFQVRYYGPGGPGESEGLHEGDVLCSNHPQLAGGSHLPDITVITPVFRDGSIVFFVASRGHHADIGGISPGSMPPSSRLLVEEGAAIVSFKLVRAGVFQEQGVTDLLMAPGQLATAIPGCSGTRNLSDNLSDLRAQVAANQRGIQLVGELINEHTLDVVVAYMRHIQANAEAAVREMLREFSLVQGLPEVGTVEAEDVMDDGTPIRLAITIDRTDGSAVFDFEGTGPEVYGNTNAPPAVAYSAIIYALRCLVRRDIPLNQGCLAPVTVKIPEACMLNPSAEAAVVGGNVLTSQRVTDVVLRAFQAAAASQGCMNNLTFGDEGMGYYETIAGGAGAGPTWHGRSGVHTHMTNTRITDPEILERRYPVVLRRFELRAGSGGDGLHRGGDGVVRELEALRPLSAGILSERRSVAPFGLQGGLPGAPGLNLLVRHTTGRTVNLGGKSTFQMQAGDRLVILTPGAGAFGAAPPGSLAEEERAPQGGSGVVSTMHNAEVVGAKRARAAAGQQEGSTNGEGGGRRVQLKGSVYEYQRQQESA